MDLKDVAGPLGAMASMVIACTIFLHQIIAQMIPAYDAVARLGGEFRKMNGEDQEKKDGAFKERQARVRAQVDVHHRRCHALRHALGLVTFGEIFFIAAMVISGLSVFFPNQPLLVGLGCTLTFIGLMTLAGASALEIYQNSLWKWAIDQEVSDIFNPKKTRDKDITEEHPPLPSRKD